jgi:RNA polymerase sigma-70 factor (ECF subfamily)
MSEYRGVPLAADVPVPADAVAEPPAASGAALDDERLWLGPLTSSGPEHDHAVRELHSLLLRASAHEVRRRAAALGIARDSELDDIAHQAADDALLAVMARLERFERRSRFTTWAYKFAIHTAGVAVRRHAWRDRALAANSSETLSRLADRTQSPIDGTETRELLADIVEAIALLTPHQRDVLIALAVDGVPIDVLADCLSTTRGALYKTLHDARTRLRGLLDYQETTT